MNKGKKLLKLVTLLVLPLLFQSCALFKKDTVLYPISGSDFVLLKEGETLTAPKQGAFLSDLYIEQVMEAKKKNV
jgi:hypothetical protein